MTWSTGLSLTPREREWLTDPGSLTEKLVAVSTGDFRVAVHAQQRHWTSPGRPSPTHHGHDLYWCRDVTLHGLGQPWVHARTLVPAREQRLLQRLRRLGTRPLGAFLFSQPGLQRLRMDYARLKVGVARRSWFTLGHQEIILVEVFLPDFFDHL
ncbi:MAG: chorismate lyase [Natronospirillum sp.]